MTHAQTTAKVSMAAGMVEVGTNGSDWSEISGQAQSIEVPAQVRKSGEAYTFTGDTALVAGGKREPVEVTVKILYTEEAAEAFEIARAEFEADDGDDFYVRWTPSGGAAADFVFSTGAGELVSFEYPPMDASSGDPILCSFTVKCAAITKSAVAS